MATLEYEGHAAAGRGIESAVLGSALAVPPTFFSITMGLAGLATAWRVAAELWGSPPVSGTSSMCSPRPSTCS
jgi:hypothetical protein